MSEIFKKHKFNLPAEGITDKEKKRLIDKAAKHYAKYMDVLLPGWQNDPNSKDTPTRVAKAFVEDISKGLYDGPPKITAFDNVEGYTGIVLQSAIPIRSLCSHHHQAIYGLAFVAYIPSKEGKIIGLSKLNRIVEKFSRTPQVQENLTQQIHDAVHEICEANKGVAVVIRAKHNCVGHRGVNHDSDMSTAVLTGGFQNEDRVRDEFYKLIELSNK
jgi:GTP cyclohydrolase I